MKIYFESANASGTVKEEPIYILMQRRTDVFVDGEMSYLLLAYDSSFKNIAEIYKNQMKVKGDNNAAGLELAEAPCTTEVIRLLNNILNNQYTEDTSDDFERLNKIIANYMQS